MRRRSELTPIADVLAVVLWDILRRCEEYANHTEPT